MSGIEFKNVYKDYVPGIHAVTDLNLTIEDGEFVVLVGPSGCGKSTTLRMLAGLEEITAGDIYIEGQRVNSVHPKDRNIAMVFQNYALYPNMSVAQNMSFALENRKVPKNEIKSRVHEAAKILQMEDLLDRKPANLSGGQRQRVAMGRAIVRDAEGRILVCELVYKRFWDLPGGVVDLNYRFTLDGDLISRVVIEP